MHKPKVVLVVMDGWGHSLVHKGNAILQAKTPTFDMLWENYAHTLLNAFGENVGLPWGSIGSSEVGHTSIGSGMLIHQELSKIDNEIARGNFFKNKVILDFINQIKTTDKNIHLIGLVSDGGVHSHLEHLYAFFQIIKDSGFKNQIFLHIITDGRDSSPKSALLYIKAMKKNARSSGISLKIASISGRYYAMDRDNRWDRTKKAYSTMTQGEGELFSSPEEAIRSNYDKNISDEFIVPCLIDTSKQSGGFLKNIFDSNKKTSPKSFVQNGDGVIFFNTRPDRMRQIVEMFTLPKKEIATEPVENIKILTLTTYNEYLPVEVAYPTEKLKNTLAKILSDHGYKQGHFAETEKYAHVTYFFNGCNPEPFPGEEWHLVPSQKVATYDLKPEMSAREITDEIFNALNKKKLDFILINYANADMVGHTGVFNAVIKAVETIDAQLKRLYELLPETTILITADHGNAECMVNPETGEIDKRHTVNPVPFIAVNEKYYLKQPISDESLQPTGILADITPSILSIFDIKKPEEMNGVNILDNFIRDLNKKEDKK